jgi:hypothetical protein
MPITLNLLSKVKTILAFERLKLIKSKPKWWTIYWIIIVVVTIIIGVTLPIIQHIPLQNAVLYLSLALVAEGIAYYGRLKPSINLTRIMYILIGVPLGSVFWFFLWMVIIRQIYPQAAENDLIVVLSIIGCYIAGFVIGDLIGRFRHYKGPEQYSP